MQIIDVLTAPWAIMPDKLIEIRSIYDARKRGESIDIEAVERRIGKPLQNDNQGYQIRSGVAVIPVHGVISKRMNLFSEISGGASTELIARDINAAIDDPDVESILLHIDSPGGSVDGVENLADIVRAASEQKPVLSFADGTMASAAYWIGSAADTVVASSSTTHIGSIGVVATHTDVSKLEESRGIKTTEISAGKYKRIASQYAPLSEDGRAEIQDQVDQIYTIFVDSVAQSRGATSEKVLADMADGRVFLAREAQARGMIDYIASLDATIHNMANGIWPADRRANQVPNKPANQQQTASDTPPNIEATESNLDIQTLREKHPQIVAEIMAEGAQAERDRIKGCEDACLPGHEKLVSTMKFDGKSTGSDVALAIVSEEKKLRSKHLDDFQSNAPDPVPHAATPAVENADSQDNESLTPDQKMQKKWDSDASLQKEFGGNYQSFVAFEKAKGSGKVKILGGK